MQNVSGNETPLVVMKNIVKKFGRVTSWRTSISRWRALK